MKQLYYLKNDISEIQNLFDMYPEIVAELNALVDKMRNDLSDADNLEETDEI